MECFPLRYPDSFYAAATADPPKLLSVAAIDLATGALAGAIVGRPVRATAIDVDDRIVAGYMLDALDSDLAVYVQTLGVLGRYRRQGLARTLLRRFLAAVQAHWGPQCRLVYLHVLSSNAPARHLYELEQFVAVGHLPGYYTIDRAPHDADLYLLLLPVRRRRRRRRAFSLSAPN